MDFTREPIIETVITPKDGCKLVVRSSKSTGQEEYFVDSVEVVSFGNSFFFRSLERPKSFLVPASDYEILEVREARMVLKNVGLDKSIKIAGGREGSGKAAKELVPEKPEPVSYPEDEVQPTIGATPENRPEGRLDKKRDRRGRHYRRRRGREGGESEEGGEVQEGEDIKIELPVPKKGDSSSECSDNCAPISSILTSLLPPPPTLISETIARYKDNALFKGAFFTKDDQKELPDSEETTEQQNEGDQESEDEEVGGEGAGNEQTHDAKEDEDILGDERELFQVPLEQPEYGSFSMSIVEEEEIYRQRIKPTEEHVEQAPLLEEEFHDNGGTSNENSHPD